MDYNNNKHISFYKSLTELARELTVTTHQTIETYLAGNQHLLPTDLSGNDLRIHLDIRSDRNRLPIKQSTPRIGLTGTNSSSSTALPQWSVYGIRA